MPRNSVTSVRFSAGWPWIGPLVVLTLRPAGLGAQTASESCDANARARGRARNMSGTVAAAECGESGSVADLDVETMAGKQEERVKFYGNCKVGRTETIANTLLALFHDRRLVGRGASAWTLRLSPYRNIASPRKGVGGTVHVIC